MKLLGLARTTVFMTVLVVVTGLARIIHEGVEVGRSGH